MSGAVRSGSSSSPLLLRFAAPIVLVCGFLVGMFAIPLSWQEAVTGSIPGATPPPGTEDLLRLSAGNRKGWESATTILAADGGPRYSRVHCVCGPAGVSASEFGCVPVVENALVEVVPSVSVEFKVFLPANVSTGKAAEHEVNRMRLAFDSCRARSYYPTASTTFSFSLHVGSSSNEAGSSYQEACTASGANVRSEVLFLIVRWGGWTPFHNLFDHGLFQVWMGWHTIKKYVEEKVFAGTGRRLLDVPAIHVVQCMMGFQPPFPPIHDIWLNVLRPRAFHWMEKTIHCSAFAVVGDLPASLSGNHRHFDHLFVSPGLQSYFRNFSQLATARLAALFGDAQGSFDAEVPVMYDNRQVLDTFDHDQRSRGIQPALKAEFVTVLDRLVGKGVTRDMSSDVPLRDQFRWLRSARVIVGGEGALFAFMFLSRPNTTWICVYNHTRPPRSFKFTNFHAPAAHALTWIRVIFYMIDHGRRVPVANALEPFFPSPTAFTPGVFYVGSNRFGHRAD